jgi:hypothetical protein
MSYNFNSLLKTPSNLCPEHIFLHGLLGVMPLVRVYQQASSIVKQATLSEL